MISLCENKVRTKFIVLFSRTKEIPSSLLSFGYDENIFKPSCFGHFVDYLNNTLSFVGGTIIETNHIEEGNLCATLSPMIDLVTQWQLFTKNNNADVDNGNTNSFLYHLLSSYTKRYEQQQSNFDCEQEYQKIESLLFPCLSVPLSLSNNIFFQINLCTN